jgi:hypothetical protein
MTTYETITHDSSRFRMFRQVEAHRRGTGASPPGWILAEALAQDGVQLGFLFLQLDRAKEERFGCHGEELGRVLGAVGIGDRVPDSVLKEVCETVTMPPLS